MKEIPVINYIKVLLLTIFTVVLVLILANVYTNKNNYERENSDIMNFLSKISYEDLTNYLVENQDGFIYMSSSSDASLDEFEEDLKNYILNNELDKVFVYLDSNEFNDDTYKSLKNNYFSSKLSNIQLNSKPTVLVIRDQKIVDILNEDITIEKVSVFVASNEVTE